MAVLVQLAAKPDAVVTRQALLDAVWPDTEVGEHVLTRAIYALRQSFAAVSNNDKTVQTVSKGGYRLLLPVAAAQTAIKSGDSELNRTLPGLPRGDAVAVLPLQLTDPQSTHAFLGAGIARDLTQLLSLIPGLRVVGSISVENAAGTETNLTKLASQLNARYVVSGSLETRGDQLRLRAELVDTQDQQQLWSNRYDAALAYLFDVQDRIVQAMARSLSNALAIGAVQQLQHRAPFNLSAYEHVQLAEDARRRYDRSAATFIVEQLQSALAIQPHNGVVHAMLAMQLSQNLVSGWAADPLETRQAAAEHLSQALAYAANDSRVLMAAGIAGIMRGDHQTAKDYLERSLARNPNESHTLAELGTARYFVTRELEPSIDMLEEAERTAPDHPRYGIWAYRRGICYYEAGAIDAAIPAFDEASARMPTYGHIQLTKAVALASVDRNSEAIAAIRNGAGSPPTTPYAQYEAGVLAFGLTIPVALRERLTELWCRAAEAD